MSEITGDFGVLREEAELIDVTSSLPYADPEWTYTDRAGHQHHYSKGYPTLAWVVDETYWCEDCQDEHQEGHWECPLCGERITPGLKGPDMFRRQIPGMVSYYLNDEPISEARYRELVAQVTARGDR